MLHGVLAFVSRVSGAEILHNLAIGHVMKQIARTGSLYAAAMALLFSIGCTGSLDRWVPGVWVADYEAAEQHIAETGRPMLIHYEKGSHQADKSSDAVLNSSLVKRLSANHVRCRLFRSFEPHRRYVAQFGVDRAPALIVVHRDGTYHSRVGLMSSAEAATFLVNAQPPGAKPRIDPYLPRSPRYHWHQRIEEAERTAQRAQAPVLIVFHRTLTSDWARLERILTRREVHTRFANLVHCCVGVLNPWSKAYITRFGALKLPAIVLLRRDGTFEVLELPTSYAAVALFADAALGPRPTPKASRAAGGSPESSWGAERQARD